jgi:phosphoenolpyruvate carboxykinase (GTP)
MGDYWDHWLAMGARASRPPAIFQVNWFRTDDSGKFIWPGFGENMRVLQWVRARALGLSEGNAARETPIGIVPTAAAIGTDELGISARTAEQLFDVNRDDWMREAEDQTEFLQRFGDHLPAAIRTQHEQLVNRLSPIAV